MKMKSRTSIALKLAAAASVALAGAALAHPHQGGERKDEIHQVIILQKSDGKDGGKPAREFRMLRGAGGEFTCPNGEATKIDETTGGDRTKIVICGDDKLSRADGANKLEETLAKMRAQEHMSAEHKAKVETALQEAIARLRASN
jgi:hypothetical protein